MGVIWIDLKKQMQIALIALIFLIVFLRRILRTDVFSKNLYDQCNLVHSLYSKALSSNHGLLTNQMLVSLETENPRVHNQFNTMISLLIGTSSGLLIILIIALFKQL